MRALRCTLLVRTWVGIGLLGALRFAGPTPSAIAQSTPPSAPGSQPPAGALMETYQAGMRAFAAGNYQAAAASLREVTAKAEDSPQLEGIYYTIGAALYNLPDYPEAIKAFTTYRTKFPKGTRQTDAAFALAQANLAIKNYPEAARLLQGLESVPALRERSLLLQAGALKEGGKTDDAIAALKRLVGPDPRTPLAMQGALTLVGLLAEKGDANGATALLTALAARPALLNNAVQLNGITLELGDRALKANNFPSALTCYRLARPRDEVVEIQKRRLAATQRAVQVNLEAIRANPSQIAELAAAGADLRAEVVTAQGQLAEAEKLPPRLDAALLMRMARCFSELDGKWESVVLMREVVDHAPPGSPDREPAYFGLVTSLAEVAPAEEIRRACTDYLREYPQGANADAVGYLSGATALQTQDLDAAASAFGRMLESQPNSPFREQMLYGLANARFLQGKYDEALGVYRRYQQAHPKGSFAEEVLYRIGIAQFFTGKQEEAAKTFNGYGSQYPQGVYLPDVRYRQAMIHFAAEQYPEAIADCERWEKTYGDNTLIGEVLSLKGDSFAGMDRADEAIRSYERGAIAAATDEVRAYTLNEACKLLQKAARWDQVAAFAQEFVKAHPESPVALPALGWVGKAKSREGKIDEARAFLADTVRKYLDDPSRDAVEPMLSQLAALCMKRPPAAAVAAGPNVTGTDAAPSPPSAYDPEKTFNALFAADEKTGASPTAQARLLFARAELARLRKKPAEADAAMQAIAEKIKPEDLSQALLAQVGDHVLSRGQSDRATALFKQLMEEHPKGDYIDFAYNGLGEIAFQKKDYPTALRYFTDATEKIPAAAKLKDVTVGRAKTLLALNKLEDAKKTFMQIASVREWRGESTAFATYSLGEIEFKQGRWVEANTYFQRVFVVYQKFLPWVAKAYLSSAECFDKLGKTKEAGNTLREMLRNAKLADFTEATVARDRLEKMGAS